MTGGPLWRDQRHFQATHRRWVAEQNRSADSPGYKEAWVWEQCGGCVFWVPLASNWGGDWGVCSNESSAFDRRAMFEHDGCIDFLAADQWVTPGDA